MKQWYVSNVFAIPYCILVVYVSIFVDQFLTIA